MLIENLQARLVELDQSIIQGMAQVNALIGAKQEILELIKTIEEESKNKDACN
jgi:hypothetical protein